MRTSTKSALQKLIIAEIAKQTDKRKSTGARRLTEAVANAKFKVDQVVIARDGDESEQTIAVVYPNVALALAAAINDRDLESAEQLATDFFDRKIKANVVCYKMKENGYIYPESDLEPA